MKGIHPDVIFSEAERQLKKDPYVSAMDKWRDKSDTQQQQETIPRERRKALLAYPDYYGLTEQEIEAVRSVVNRK